MHAAVPSVSAEAAPAVTMAASQRSRLARYSPALVCNSIKRTGCLAERATAAWTEGGMVDDPGRAVHPAGLAG